MLHDIEALLYVKCCKMSAEITQAMWTSLWLAMDLAPDGLVTTELGSPSARHRLLVTPMSNAHMPRPPEQVFYGNIN